MPEAGIEQREHRDIMSYETIRQIAKTAVNMGFTKIRLTGGEPLVRKGIENLVTMLREISDLHELNLTTNGILLTDKAAVLKKNGLDRLNISLDTLDAIKFKEMTRGGDISQVFAGIAAAQAAGFHNTKINMVLIPGFNDHEIETMQKFCQDNELTLQRIHHYSLQKRDLHRPVFEAERPLACGSCNRIRLTADGHLKPCLFSNQEFPVDLHDIAASIQQAIQAKPAQGNSCTGRGNWQIGG